jgi:hypothetical protein
VKQANKERQELLALLALEKLALQVKQALQVKKERLELLVLLANKE